MKEEKEPIKISLSLFLILFIFIVIISLIILYSIVSQSSNQENEIKSSEDTKVVLGKKISIKDEIKEEDISNIVGIDLQCFNEIKKNFLEETDNELNKSEQTYQETKYKKEADENFNAIEEYIKYNDNIVTQIILEELNNKKKYDEEDEECIVSEKDLDRFYAYVYSGLIKYHIQLNNYDINVKYINVKYNNDTTMSIEINNKYYALLVYNSSKCIFEISMKINETEYTVDLYKELLEGYKALKHDRHSVDPAKPIIYIYPTQETEIEVKLGNPQYLSCTYPQYEEGWKVTAKPNGDLVDTKTGRSLYALYWEGENVPKITNREEGFCIKGKDTASFLEEKLATLGLSNREAEEFIVYWLPKMEDNNYNYIRFETIEEQNEAMPLEVTPKPDNIIRVMMDWKALDNEIEVREQKLETPSREGYTVVEWGGSELK